MLYSSDAYPGRIYKLTLEGKVLGVLGSSGKQLKQFGWVHEIACPSENELYVGELLNWRVQKLLLSPTSAEAKGKYVAMLVMLSRFKGTSFARNVLACVVT